MFFLTSQTKAKFYNESQMTFLVQKDSIDIIFKINRGVYITVNVYSLSDGRLLLACSWDNFFNRLKSMRNRNEVLCKLKKVCPLAANIFTNTVSPHFAYIDKDKENGAVVVEMKAPIQSNSVADFLHEKVISKAMELVKYNLNLQVELEEKCPFPAWTNDLEKMK